MKTIKQKKGLTDEELIKKYGNSKVDFDTVIKKIADKVTKVKR